MPLPPVQVLNTNANSKERAFVNTSLRTAGSVVTLILQFSSVIILSRLLPVEAFGVLTYAMIFVNFADLASQMGVGPALIQRPELSHTSIRAGFTISFAMGLMAAVTLFLLAPFVADDSQTALVLQSLSLIFLFMGVTVVSGALLQREHRFKELVIAECSSYFIGYLVVSVGLALAGFGIWSLVAGVLTNSILRGAIFWSRTRHSLRPYPVWSEMRPLVRFGMLFTVTRVLNFSATTGDAFLTGRLLGNGPLGLYSRAFQLVRLPARLVTNSMHTVLFPVLSRMTDLHVIKSAYHRATMFALCLMTALCCIVIVTAPELIEVPFGIKWQQATLPLRILAPVAVFSVYTLGDALLKSTNHLKSQLFAHATFCVILITSVVFFSRFGINGVAAGVLLSNVVMYTYMTCVCGKILKSSWSDFAYSHVPAMCVGIPVLVVGWTTRSAAIYLELPAWIVWIFATSACVIAFFLLSVVPLGGPLRDYQTLFGQFIGTMCEKSRYTKRVMQSFSFPHAKS